MSKETTAVEVVTKEQGEWIDQSKALLSAIALTEKTSDVYHLALGGRLHLIKKSCPHGAFEDLKKAHFPDEARSTLGMAMTYCDAAEFFAKGKYPTIGYLTQGDFFLTNGEIPKAEISKAEAELAKVTSGMSRANLIKEYRKKTAPKAEPADAVKKEELHQKAIAASFADAAAALELVLELKDADFVLAGPLRKTLAQVCVRYGKRNKTLKAAKTKKS